MKVATWLGLGLGLGLAVVHEAGYLLGLGVWAWAQG